MLLVLKKNALQPTCAICGKEDGKYKCPKCRIPYCFVRCCQAHKNEQEDKTIIKKEDATPKKSSTGKYLPASDILSVDPIQNALKRRKMLNDDDDDDDQSEDEEEDEEGWRITRDMMNKINSSKWLRQELKDGGLRRLIYVIDVADEKEGVYQKKKKKKRWRRNEEEEEDVISAREKALVCGRNKNPNLDYFLDRLLVTAGVLMRVNNNGEVVDEEDGIMASGWDVDEEGNVLLSRERLVLAPPASSVRKRLCEVQEGDLGDGDEENGFDADEINLDLEGESSCSSSTSSNGTSSSEESSESDDEA